MALVVIISLVIIVPVLVAGGVMMYQSHKRQHIVETAQDKERSVSTDIADVESGGRLRDIVVENFRRKRASLEGIGGSEFGGSRSTSSSSTKGGKPPSSKRLRRGGDKVQLTKVQSEDATGGLAETRVPSTAVEGV